MKTEVPFDHIDEFEKDLSVLIGKSLTDVTYYEIHQENPFYDQSSHHLVDFGVELTFDDASLYHIVWNDKFHQFDIKFGTGSIGQEINLGEDSSVKPYCLNEDDQWSKLIHKKVTEVKSYWNWWKVNGEELKSYYPKDISIRFESNEIVYFSCTSIENEKFLASADEISVFFNLKIAQKYGVGIIDYMRVLRT